MINSYIPNMINTGQFGYSNPMPNYNQYQQPQQYNQGYVYAPVGYNQPQQYINNGYMPVGNTGYNQEPSNKEFVYVPNDPVYEYYDENGVKHEKHLKENAQPLQQPQAPIYDGYSTPTQLTNNSHHDYYNPMLNQQYNAPFEVTQVDGNAQFYNPSTNDRFYNPTAAVENERQYRMQVFGYGMPTNNYVNPGPFPTAQMTYNSYREPNSITYNQRQLYDRYDHMTNRNIEHDYSGLSRFMSAKDIYTRRMQDREEQLDLLKLKMEIACAGCGKKLNEEEFERVFNPTPVVISDDEMIKKREFDNMKYLGKIFSEPPVFDTPGMSIAKRIAAISRNYHAYFDDMPMQEFLDNHLWRLKREAWLRENIDLNQDKDLSLTYSSKDYNDLLSMHEGINSYARQLLDTSRYENNTDDLELGIKEAFDLLRRKKNILEGKVPKFISDNKTIKARNEWMNGILDQVAYRNERRARENGLV